MTIREVALAVGAGAAEIRRIRDRLEDRLPEEAAYLSRLAMRLDGFVLDANAAADRLGDRDVDPTPSLSYGAHR